MTHRTQPRVTPPREPAAARPDAEARLAALEKHYAGAANPFTGRRESGVYCVRCGRATDTTVKGRCLRCARAARYAAGK